jgi:flagellar motility protein MotE (MotC chaperone)
MAKKNKEENTVDGQEKESAGSKAVTALIALIIIIIWLAVFAFLIKLDVGGIGSNVLYPVLKDVPVINKILPEPSEEQQAEEGNYKYNTLKAANERISELEQRLESESGTTTANSDYIAELEAEVKKLQVYKDEQDAFKKQVKEFDEKVVYTDNAPDISEYRQYYEEIEPENAENIYKQVLYDLQYSEKAEELGARYAKMDAASAAKILTEMSEDLDLVCDILSNMKDSEAAEIIQNLDSTYAAQITKKIASVKSN